MSIHYIIAWAYLYNGSIVEKAYLLFTASGENCTLRAYSFLSVITRALSAVRLLPVCMCIRLVLRWESVFRRRE